MSTVDPDKLLLIDKPYQWTSFDAIRFLKRNLPVKKIGHAGTLDPLATGLLLICTGKKTKQIESFQQLEKEYEGEMIIGKTTPSIDLETSFDTETDWSTVTEEQIRIISNRFIGAIQQVPPDFSAARVNGVRSYKMARKGEVVLLQPRIVFIKELIWTKINIPSLSFRVVCSKGTYIRSLVRDIGKELGVGAYMQSLRRTRIGEFSIDKAYTPHDYCKENIFYASL